MAAADELAEGSLEAAGRYLTRAERLSGWCRRPGKYGRLLVGCPAADGPLAGEPAAVADDARQLQALAEVRTRRNSAWARNCALALSSLGSTEFLATLSQEAERVPGTGHRARPAGRAALP